MFSSALLHIARAQSVCRRQQTENNELKHRRAGQDNPAGQDELLLAKLFSMYDVLIFSDAAGLLTGQGWCGGYLGQQSPDWSEVTAARLQCKHFSLTHHSTSTISTLAVQSFVFSPHSSSGSAPPPSTKLLWAPQGGRKLIPSPAAGRPSICFRVSTPGELGERAKKTLVTKKVGFPRRRGPVWVQRRPLYWRIAVQLITMIEIQRRRDLQCSGTFDQYLCY